MSISRSEAAVLFAQARLGAWMPKICLVFDAMHSEISCHACSEKGKPTLLVSRTLANGVDLQMTFLSALAKSTALDIDTLERLLEDELDSMNAMMQNYLQSFRFLDDTALHTEHAVLTCSAAEACFSEGMQAIDALVEEGKALTAEYDPSEIGILLIGRAFSFYLAEYRVRELFGDPFLPDARFIGSTFDISPEQIVTEGMALYEASRKTACRISALLTDEKGNAKPLLMVEKGQEKAELTPAYIGPIFAVAGDAIRLMIDDALWVYEIPAEMTSKDGSLIDIAIEVEEDDMKLCIRKSDATHIVFRTELSSGAMG